LCTHPNAILSVRINGKIMNRDLVSKVIAFLCLFMLLIVAGGTVLSFMGLPAVDSFFSSFSCICNTGFGASLTGYGDDFLTIPAGAKWILSLLMLTGRLEVFTVMVLFTPSFWK
ncbi:MAG: TrkH family potassium uptake protein, partial [Muribaculaceae bacterium]|nr:TrkH family potassium uptake protein [Muribaculaceae bacterium]